MSRDEGTAAGGVPDPPPPPDAAAESAADLPLAPRPAEHPGADAGSHSTSAPGSGERIHGSGAAADARSSGAFAESPPSGAAEDADADAFWNTGPPEHVPEEPDAPPGPRKGGAPADEAARRQGRNAALTLFFISAVLTVPPALSGMELEAKLLLTAGLDGMVAIGGPILAVIVSLVLPKAARPAFWTTGALCILATLLMWGVTCGLMAAPTSPHH